MIKITKNFKSASMAKQVPFATARALTETAKDAQKNIIENLPRTFTVRNNWYKPNTPLGIKVKAAKKTDLRAEVGSNFDALEKFETGKDKLPKGQHIAVPTAFVRRTKRQIIQKGQRPKALRGKRTFVLNTKSGKVLFQRKFKGKRGKLVPLYNLEKRAKIRKNSPVIVPARETVRLRIGLNFNKAMAEAMRTAK